MLLTDLAIRKLPVPEKGQKTYWEKGLGIRISQGGTRTFIAKINNQQTTLGRYPTMSLKQARQAFLIAKTAEYAPQPISSLTEARTAYLAECEDKLRPATVDHYRHFLSSVHKERLQDVKKTDIDLTSPHAITSWKVFFNWCVRNELVERNPFTFEKATYRPRDRVLTNDELRNVWHYTWPPYSDYLKLLILTGQRRGQFQKYEIRDDTLYFPAEIMKGKVDHLIPASPLVLELVDRLEPFNGWSKAKQRCDLHSYVRDWTVHDLRRTFSTINASIGTPIHVVEKILAHTSGAISGVAAIYNRHSYMAEMRTALDSYEKHIQTIIT